MSKETRRCLKSRIHVAESNHRRSPRDRRSKKEGKLVNEMTNGWLITGTTLINLGRKAVPGHTQCLAKESDLVLFGLEIGQILVSQDEVQKEQTCAYEFE